MPNWCNNVVEIAHEDPAKLKVLVEAFREGKLCNFAIPVPEELNITAGFLGKDTPEQAELELKEQANLDKHGYKNWWDFCVSEWGTKWDVEPYDTVELKDGDTQVTISFDSAWSPPCGVYAALVDQGYQIRAYYYEPGMCFAGIWDNGDEDFYDFGNMTTAEVEADISPELDEIFAITENMRMWDEENEEETNESE